MDDNLLLHVRSLHPIIMLKTREEERVLKELHETFTRVNQRAEERAKGKKSKSSPGYSLHVWNAAFGILDSGSYLDEMQKLAHPQDRESMNVHKYLTKIYATINGEHGRNLYVAMLDADNYLGDPMIRRRLKNLAISSNEHPQMNRTLVLFTRTGKVPADMAEYVELVDFDDPSDSLIRDFLTSLEVTLREHDKEGKFTFPAGRDLDAEIPDAFIRACRSMTLYQLKQTLHRLVMQSKMQVTTEMMVAENRRIIEESELLDLMQTDLTFDNVAGLDLLKARLNEVKQAWTPEGRAWGVPNSRGLLMIGVPGCGKSLTAKALANEMGVTFIKFDPSSLFSSRVGDSEANMRRALRQIEACAPAVVFIDEIEKGLAGIQSSSFSDSGTTARVIGTFLSWFEDHDEDIFVIATANGIQTLPPELVSRFEEKYFVGLPDQEARESCFSIQLGKYHRETMGDKDAIDCKALAETAANLTGREIEQALKDAMRKAFMTEDQTLTTEIIQEVVRTKPPLVQTMHEEIRAILGWVGYDPARQEGVRAKYASSDRIVELGAMGYSDPGEGTNKLDTMFNDIDLN